MWNSSVVKEFDGLALFLEHLHTGGSLGDAIAIGARHNQRVCRRKAGPRQLLLENPVDVAQRRNWRRAAFLF